MLYYVHSGAGQLPQLYLVRGSPNLIPGHPNIVSVNIAVSATLGAKNIAGQKMTFSNITVGKDQLFQDKERALRQLEKVFREYGKGLLKQVTENGAIISKCTEEDLKNGRFPL